MKGNSCISSRRKCLPPRRSGNNRSITIRRAVRGMTARKHTYMHDTMRARGIGTASRRSRKRERGWLLRAVCRTSLSLSLSFFSLPLSVFHFLRGLRVYRLSVFLAAQRCRLDAAERNPRCLARESRFPSLSFSAFVCEIMCAKGLCMCVRRIIARNTGWLSLPPFFSGPFFRLRPLAATCVCILPNDCPLVWLWVDDQDIEARYEAVSLLF